MKIHLLQTGVVRVKPFQLKGASNNLSRIFQLLFTKKWSEWLPIYCWLIEHPEGLILVDTGETNKINEEGYLPNSKLYHKAVQTKITREDEVDFQLAKIGFKPKDIKKVILTHLHGDHVGGIYHFAHAKFIVPKKEYEFATSPKGKKMGYMPHHWPSWFKPELITFTDSAEGNFDASKILSDDQRIVAVPTPGHSVGHMSVIAKTENKNVILAGDITYNEEMLRNKIPAVVIYNKESQDSVNRMLQYVDTNKGLMVSSHDTKAQSILDAALE